MFRPAIALFFISLSTLAADVSSLPTFVAPSDKQIRYIGRFDTKDPAGPRCAWSGSSIVARFEGTMLNAKIKGNNDFVQVMIDGKPSTALAITSAQTVYRLAEGLSEGEHTVELFKRTEPMVGTIQFLGFELPPNKKLLDPPARLGRRIELIGDSITCGYGNEDTAKENHFKPITENNYVAYGAVAARDVKAEYVCIAWSGRKMWPNNTIPEIYDRILPNDPQSKWDFTSWTPDVVVINLGTNDFGQGNPEEKGWTDAYKAFLKIVRANYNNAMIYCAVGSMMSDNWPPEKKSLSTICGYLTRMVDELNKAGDKNIRYLEFAPQDQANGIGADWHPSVKTNRIMADTLVAALKKDLGW
jgi:lysophospholipase L1-like esterase